MKRENKTYVAVIVTSVAILLTTTVSAESWFQIRPHHNNKMCLSVAESSNANHAKIVQESCSDSKSQRWKWSGDKIQNQNSGRCLDVESRSKNNHAELQQYTCVDVPNQRFDYNMDKQIVAMHSSKCLDITGRSQKAGAKLQQYGCAGVTNQKFDIKGVTAFDGQDLFWTRMIKISDPAIVIYGTSMTTDSAMKQHKKGLNAIIDNLKSGYSKDKLKNYTVYVTNGEAWADLKPVSPVGSMWSGTIFDVPKGDFYRGGTNSQLMWVSEQMMCKTGVATRTKAVKEGRSKESDTHVRVFDHLVHEFSHTLQRRFNLANKDDYKPYFASNVEIFPGVVQNYFGVPARTVSAEHVKYLNSVFKEKLSFSCTEYNSGLPKST